METLKKSPQWVNWRRDPERGKIPKNPKTGGNAQSNNPSTWASYELAEKVRHKYDGVGFMFSNGICGIDIDGIDTPKKKEQAQAIMELMSTYTEYSPSGNGYHIIFRCDISKVPQIKNKLDPAYYQKNPQKNVECYLSGLTNRFFTYTGEAVNSYDIEDRTDQLLTFLDKYMRKENPQERDSVPVGVGNTHSTNSVNHDVISIAKRAKNGNKFMMLFDLGDTSEYNNDDSSADIALCNMLAFYCLGMPDAIDYYFRQSALYREKWEREDYRERTINDAINRQKQINEYYQGKISICGVKYYKKEIAKPPGRPKKEKKQTEYDGQTEFVTIENLTQYLQDKNISVKYNEITHRLDIDGLDKSITRGHSQNALPTILFNEMRFIYEKVQKGDIRDFLDIIALHNKYNPVLEMIQSIKWDGTNRIHELYNILNISEEDKLSKTLIYKWLWQCLSMAKNVSTNTQRAYGADGVLVLVGDQGIGKTSFFRKLAIDEDFFVEGKRLNMDNKDTIIQATAAWITELGEIGSTFRSDLDNLKAFITNKTDQYRKPYGHSDLTIERKTSFCGTCNDMEYLIDQTGNRRFWSVPVDNIDLQVLDKLDALQLWAQVEELTHTNTQGFRLTRDEQAELAERNSRHEKPLKSEQEVRDIFNMAKRCSNDFAFKLVTVTEFIQTHDALKKYSATQISKVLNKMGVEPPLNARIDGKFSKLRPLPVWKSLNHGNTKSCFTQEDTPDSENPFLTVVQGKE